MSEPPVRLDQRERRERAEDRHEVSDLGKDPFCLNQRKEAVPGASRTPAPGGERRPTRR